MPDTINVIPAPGLRVLDPTTREPLPAEGAEVERSSYWLRRLRDGDVTEAAVVTPASQPTEKQATKKVQTP